MRDREEFEEYEEDSPKPKKKKHLLYRLFNGDGNGKDILPEPEGPDNILKCFKIYKRNITRLLYVNLLIIFGNFPLLLGLYGICIGIYQSYSKKKGALYTQQLRNYQQRRREENGK